MNGESPRLRPPLGSIRGREGTWPGKSSMGPAYTPLEGALRPVRTSSLAKRRSSVGPARWIHGSATSISRGWVSSRACPRDFGNPLPRDWAAGKFRDEPPEDWCCKEARPWLDQVTLPLGTHIFGGGPARTGASTGSRGTRKNLTWPVLRRSYYTQGSEGGKDRALGKKWLAPHRLKKGGLKKPTSHLKKRFSLPGRAAQGQPALLRQPAAALPRRSWRNLLKEERLFLRCAEGNHRYGAHGGKALYPTTRGGRGTPCLPSGDESSDDGAKALAPLARTRRRYMQARTGARVLFASVIDQPVPAQRTGRGSAHLGQFASARLHPQRRSGPAGIAGFSRGRMTWA